MNDAADSSSLPTQERALITAAARGVEAYLGRDGQQTPIRAETLRDLCAGANPRWRVQRSIWVTGAVVVGRLDLSGAYLAYGIRFRDCFFADGVDLREARAERPLEWQGGQIANILADQLESNDNLVIQGVEITGPVSLHWANVGGDLRLTNSHLMPKDGLAIAARDMRIGGTLFMDGQFHAEGEVCLRSARIEGQLNCRHASFSNPAGRLSISADDIVVGGDVLLSEGFRANGEVCLQRASVGRLRATGGSFASATSYALHADALHAANGVYLDRGFKAIAEVRLVGARITGELCCTDGLFDNPGGRALDAERIEADDVYLDRGFAAHGQVRFTSAQVKRQLNATGAHFHNERAGDYALDADGLVCGGDVFLNDGFHAVGAVSLTGAEIKGQLNCTAGFFNNQDGYALFADGLTTPGTIYLDKDFRAIGEVRFARATVGRQLKCTDGTFDNQHGTALDLTGLVCQGDVLLNSTSGAGFRAGGQVFIRDAQITGDLDVTNARLHGDEGVNAYGLKVGGRMTWKLDPPPEGRINLSHAEISRLDDTARSWPERRYTLTGMSYQTLGDLLTLQQRITWLRHTEVYTPDAYHQLAKVYRQAGREPDAHKILIASQRDLRMRADLRWPSRIWNRFLDISVGYGYRLHRPFLILLMLGLLGTLFYYLGEQVGLIFVIVIGWGTALALISGVVHLIRYRSPSQIVQRDDRLELPPVAGQALQDAVSSSVIHAVTEVLPDILRSSLRQAVQGTPLVNFAGVIEIRTSVEAADPSPLPPSRTVVVAAGGALSLVITIRRGNGHAEAIPLKITSGEDASTVEFAVTLDSDLGIALSETQTVTLGTGTSQSQCTFWLTLPESYNEGWLWVRVAQRHRTVQSIELRLQSAEALP